MTERTVQVVCSDRGQHGRLELGGLRLGRSGVVEDVRVRTAPAPWGPGGALIEPTGERHALGPTVPARAPETRADHEGRTKFRYTCPVCSRDVPWNLETATKYFWGVRAAGRSVVDISLLP